MISDSGIQKPESLKAWALGSSQISLSWSDQSDNEEGFRIERMITGGVYREIAAVGAGSTSYTDTDLAPATTYVYRLRAYNTEGNSDYSNEAFAATHQIQAATKVIDHTCTILASIPTASINAAQSSLHIAYGHTSHGRQLINGMTGLADWQGDERYAFNSGGADGALDLRDNPFTGALDLGTPDRTAWAAATRSYLDTHTEINVVIWSWCGQVSDATAADITTYLTLMSSLENEYPNVKFVYMTGHLDGTGLTGNLHLRNEQIRDYCKTYSKYLYDFADIETYDPDGVYYGDKYPTDGCNYDYNNNGVTSQTGDPATPTNGDRNWAIDWQNAHREGVDWFTCSADHTQPVNANRKAYAAWWLWARLAGWEGQ